MSTVTTPNDEPFEVHLRWDPKVDRWFATVDGVKHRETSGVTAPGALDAIERLARFRLPVSRRWMAAVYDPIGHALDALGIEDLQAQRKVLIGLRDLAQDRDSRHLLDLWLAEDFADGEGPLDVRS